MVILVYKFKRIVGKLTFTDEFKIINVIKIWDVKWVHIMPQSGCLFVNPITVYSYSFLFNCTTVGQVSYSMTPNTSMGRLVPDVCLWQGPPWLNLSFSLAHTSCESWPFSLFLQGVLI